MIMEGSFGSADIDKYLGRRHVVRYNKFPAGRLLVQSCYSLVTKLRQICRDVKVYFAVQYSRLTDVGVKG